MEQPSVLKVDATEEKTAPRKPNAFGRFFYGLGEGIVRFAVPVGLSLVALILSICLKADFTPWRDEEALFPILRGFGAGMAIAAMLQLWFEQRNVRMKKVWELLIAVPVTLGLWLFNRGLSQSENAWLDYAPLVTLGVGLIAALIGMAIVESRTQEGSATRSAYIGAFWGGTLFLIVFSALMLFLLAIDTLLVSIDFDVTQYFLVFSLLSVGATVFLSFLPKPGQERPRYRAYSILLTYVLLPLYLVLLAILYAYIVRIALEWKMPSGQMNPFGLCAIVGFLLLWLGLKGEESPFAKWYARFGGLLLLPVIAVQVLGLWIRIDAYGLTPMRVASVAVVLLGGIAIVLSACKGKLRVFYWIAAALSLVLLVSPLNLFTIANFEQEQRLKPVLSAYGMLAGDGSIVSPDRAVSEPDKARIRSGFRYFMDASGVLSPFAEAVRTQNDVLSHLDAKTSETDPGPFAQPTVETPDFYYVFTSPSTTKIDLSSYTKIVPMERNIQTDTSILWIDPDSGELFKIDVLEFAAAMVNSVDGSDAFYEEEVPMLCPVDETHTLLIGSLEIHRTVWSDGTVSDSADLSNAWMLIRE